MREKENPCPLSNVLLEREREERGQESKMRNRSDTYHHLLQLLRLVEEGGRNTPSYSSVKCKDSLRGRGAGSLG